MPVRPTGEAEASNVKMLKTLVGSGDKIALFTLPFVVAVLVIAIVDSPMLQVGKPPSWLRAVSIPVLILGLAIWLWSVVLIVRNVPRGRLITKGPYAWVRHPLYTAVALLVLPWIGFLLDTWLGLVIGVVLYLGSRIFAPEEEAGLSRTFGEAWREYSRTVKFGWL
jgi:protein-S-isoprenylcysteine O-methyltransferase Ste14